MTMFWLSSVLSAVDEFKTASATISRTLEGIEALPVLPREGGVF